MDTILFVVASIIVVVVIRVLSKHGGNARESIRAAVERATAVPPPMTTGQYAAPANQPQQPSGGHAWPTPPPAPGGPPAHTWPAPPPPPSGHGWPTPPSGHGWPTPPPPAPSGPPPSQRRPPAPQADLDTRVRELMNSNNEVGAVRLLCDEAQMGIIEAQAYARQLVGAPTTAPTPTTGAPTTAAATTGAPERPETEERDLGSAAFATSIFETGEDEGWASGWQDTPEPDDRSDIDELWQTVRSSGSSGSGGSGGSSGEQAGDGA